MSIAFTTDSPPSASGMKRPREDDEGEPKPKVTKAPESKPAGAGAGAHVDEPVELSLEILDNSDSGALHARASDFVVIVAFRPEIKSVTYYDLNQILGWAAKAMSPEQFDPDGKSQMTVYSILRTDHLLRKSEELFRRVDSEDPLTCRMLFHIEDSTNRRNGLHTHEVYNASKTLLLDGNKPLPTYDAKHMANGFRVRKQACPNDDVVSVGVSGVAPDYMGELWKYAVNNDVRYEPDRIEMCKMTRTEQRVWPGCGTPWTWRVSMDVVPEDGMDFGLVSRCSCAKPLDMW